MSKDLDEGLLRRTLPKDLDEGLLRRTSPKDLDEGGASEGSKSVDYIINVDLHCNIIIIHFFGLKQYREKFIEITS